MRIASGAGSAEGTVDVGADASTWLRSGSGARLSSMDEAAEAPPPLPPADVRAPHGRAGLIRLALAAPLAAFSLLAVFEAPIEWLWKPAVAATEFGHLLALLAAPAFACRWRGRSGRLAGALGLLAFGLLLSPVVRATRIADDVRARLVAAGLDGPARELPGAPARPAPLELADLARLDLPAAGVEVATHVYHVEGGERLLLDLHARPDAPRPRPVVVVVHGGSWRSGDRTQLPAICGYLAARGYAVASIDHRLAPRWRFPAAHEDVLAALDWLARESAALGLDPARRALLGRSSGGHLALLAAYARSDPTVRGVVAWYPPTDMEWSWEHPSNPWVFDSPGALSGFLGGPPAGLEAVYRAASPLRFVRADGPATLLLHGGRDELVFQRQSERLSEALAAAGARHAYVPLPWATHGCDANLAGPSGQLGTWAIERFLGAVLR